jgi:serine/threonine protein kinase
MVWAKGRKLQDGKYVIKKELDQGGFGSTYLVKRDDEQKFVVKTLNDDMQKSSNFSKYQQNFVNEALRLARCSHPHIVRVEELIQERNLWGIVMEYVEGETLADLVKREGLISQDQALRYIKQVGDALVSVHQNGFLHRDVKPQNIMVRDSCDEAVLIDFGIAREFEQDKTQSHTQFLSRYFAPIEQYDKRAKRGAYTDVYALAGTLYYLVTGEYPIAAPNRAVGTELELPSEYNSDLDDWLEVAILKGLEIKPSDRPQSIQDWLDLLTYDKSDQEWQRILKQAKDLEEQGHFKDALIAYFKASKLQPNSYDNYHLWIDCARLSCRLDYFKEGVLFYEKALSTGQKFNGVEESLGIEMKVKDEVTQEIKTTTKNAFR